MNGDRAARVAIGGLALLVMLAAAMNKDIRLAAARWPQFTVAEWDSYSAPHPDWFHSDGIHLTPLGAASLGQFLHAALLHATQQSHI